MNRVTLKVGAIAAAVVLTLGSAAAPAFAQGQRHGGGHMGGGHMSGGHFGGGHMGGSFQGGGSHNRTFAGNFGSRHGWSHNRGGWNHNRGYTGGYGYGYGGYGYGGLGVGLAAGVIGGALLASQAPYYDNGYSAAYPGYGVDNGDARAYCESRFKSYNPATGTYLGYDGLRHSCP